jgi:orotate phosphoribosyltransferase
MNTNEVLDVFREAGAVLEGHFILTSGLRSPIFLQKARVFMHADKTERVCRGLADKIRAAGLGQIDYVVGPAIGGIIPAYETSRHLGVPAIWVERENGQFKLRRFEIAKGARVVIVEDIVTTGLSIRETVTCL